ncbi:MAG: P1 family peptidase [Anaerolineae bacterium]
MDPQGFLTDVAGLRVGHWTDERAATGCTVVLCEEGALAAVDVRGSAPGTRETALLGGLGSPWPVHAVVLTGGSAFGLEAASGVVRFLEEQGVGVRQGPAVVPVVPAAVLFDLALGDARGRPDAEAGYAACQAATHGAVAEGCVGAGTGASVGKLFGPRMATKAGLGTCSLRTGDGFVVGALVAVNAFGDVVHPGRGMVLAGTRRPLVGGFLGTARHMGSSWAQFLLRFARMTNTSLGVVATDATLTHEEVQKLAQMAHDGLALAIRPVHTMWDGDTLFALATGQVGAPPAGVSVLGALAAQAVATAAVRAIAQAAPLAGLPSARSLGMGERVQEALTYLASARKGGDVRNLKAGPR